MDIKDVKCKNLIMDFLAIISSLIINKIPTDK